MRQSAALFAFGLGLLAPALALGFGFGVQPWLALAGFGLGLALPAALDWLLITLPDEKSRIDQRLAQTETTWLANAERWAKLEAPASINPSFNPSFIAPDIDLDWRTACHRLLTAAEVYGFGIRQLVGRQIVTWDGWSELMGVLTKAGVTVRSPKAGWAPGWDMARWRQVRHSIALPHGQTAPPEVALVPTTATLQAQQQGREGVEGVIALD